MKFQRSYAIPAKPAPVFDALTSALHLPIWFAEQVEIGSAPGGPFRFWGKHTLWTPDATHATQTLTALAFPTRFGFAWPWNRAESQVTIGVREADGGAVVDLMHDFARAWSDDASSPGLERGAEWVVGAFWDVAIANLRHFLQHGEPLLLPDYSESGETLEIGLELEASPERVYEALTIPDQLDSWLAEGAQVELEEDGAFSFGWKDRDGRPLGPQRLIQFRPEKRLVHDWHWGKRDAGEVRWDLEGEDAPTSLTLRYRASTALDPTEILTWVHALTRLEEHVSTREEGS